jgi:magnesium transporter
MAKSPSSAAKTVTAHAVAGPVERPVEGHAVALAAMPIPAPTAVPSAPVVPAVPAVAIVRLATLDGRVFKEYSGEAALAELPKALARRTCRFWVDVTDGAPELKNRVSGLLGLHPLLAEDIAERDQRAKIEQVGDLLHIVIFSLGIDQGEIYERELDFVVGQRFLLSNHSEWWDPRTTRHLKPGLEPVLAEGPDHLLWALSDDVIDSYFPILDALGDQIDDLEDQVVTNPDRRLLERLFLLKRELIQIRRVTAPEREMFNLLSNRDEKVISLDQRIYFRDAYDHLIRLTDELDTYRELASATLETYLSTVNNNLSLIMKRLTGVTVVVAGVGAIGGIFGMSEAQTAFRFEEGPGFWFVALGSLVIALATAGVLRKMDWI